MAIGDAARELTAVVQHREPGARGGRCVQGRLRRSAAELPRQGRPPEPAAPDAPGAPWCIAVPCTPHQGPALAPDLGAELHPRRRVHQGHRQQPTKGGTQESARPPAAGVWHCAQLPRRPHSSPRPFCVRGGPAHQARWKPFCCGEPGRLGASPPLPRLVHPAGHQRALARVSLVPASPPPRGYTPRAVTPPLLAPPMMGSQAPVGHQIGSPEPPRQRVWSRRRQLGAHGESPRRARGRLSSAPEGCARGFQRGGQGRGA